MSSSIGWKQLQQNIPYQFNQVKLLETAMTHTSAANEKEGKVEHNERLEYLGDAVLELCISTELYRRFYDAREGQLTAMRSQLVNQQSLALIARSLGITISIILGKGEEAQGGREKDTILSDAFEALLGAIYLDGGYEAAVSVVNTLFAASWEKLGQKEKRKDYKSRLQEMSQLLFKDRPIYALTGSEGPEHNKEFFVSLTLPNGHVITAKGASVKRAEQNAAANALSLLEKEMHQ